MPTTIVAVTICRTRCGLGLKVGIRGWELAGIRRRKLGTPRPQRNPDRRPPEDRRNPQTTCHFDRSAGGKAGGAQWRNLSLFFARAEAVRSCITSALRAIWPEEKWEVAPLRSARLAASAPVEMTLLGGRLRRRLCCADHLRKRLLCPRIRRWSRPFAKHPASWSASWKALPTRCGNFPTQSSRRPARHRSRRIYGS